MALQIVLNYEEGGENCLLHGDAESEKLLSEIVGAAALPGQRSVASPRLQRTLAQWAGFTPCTTDFFRT